MKNTLKKVVAALDARAEREWQKLQELESHYTPDEGHEQFAGRTEQRARWAAWDSASEIAKGKGITSFETEQRSV